VRASFHDVSVQPRLSLPAPSSPLLLIIASGCQPSPLISSHLLASPIISSLSSFSSRLIIFAPFTRTRTWRTTQHDTPRHPRHATFRCLGVHLHLTSASHRPASSPVEKLSKRQTLAKIRSLGIRVSLSVLALASLPPCTSRQSRPRARLPAPMHVMAVPSSHSCTLCQSHPCTRLRHPRGGDGYIIIHLLLRPLASPVAVVVLVISPVAVVVLVVSPVAVVVLVISAAVALLLVVLVDCWWACCCCCC
jgi:hypothetical protein